MKIWLLLLAVSSVAVGQNYPSTTIPQGSSIPGLGGGLPGGLNGPGYLEVGGSHSSLSEGNPSWNDAYLRGVMSGGKNVFNGELIRQGRFGDAGWYYSLGLTRTLSENWFGAVHFGSSIGGFFLPKLRTDATINRKLLPNKQFVASAGFGYDKSKTVNSAYRTQIGGTYYFSFPIVLQGGVMWTRANPGALVARSQYLAITQGREKEHYLSVRAEIGREAYQLIGPSTTVFDFPIHNYSANWRQWLGFNWGLNFAFEHEGNPYYKRNGGTVGIFLDF